MPDERCRHWLLRGQCADRACLLPEQRRQADERKAKSRVSAAVNRRLDRIGYIRSDIEQLLLERGRLVLTTPSRHLDTFKAQWREATGRSLDEDVVRLDDKPREHFGTGAWYWSSSVEFDASEAELDAVMRQLPGLGFHKAGWNRWRVNSNDLALYLARHGLEAT